MQEHMRKNGMGRVGSEERAMASVGGEHLGEVEVGAGGVVKAVTCSHLRWDSIIGRKQ